MVGIRCLSCSLSEGFCILGFGVENGRVWMELHMWLHLRFDGKNLVGYFGRKYGRLHYQIKKGLVNDCPN